MAALSAAEIAELVGGELIGSGTVVLQEVKPLRGATPQSLSFLVSSRYAAHFHQSRAGAVLVTPALKQLQPGPTTRIVVGDVHRALRTVLLALSPKAGPCWGIAPGARIGRGVRWKGRLAVGPGAVVGRNVTLGHDCVIGAYALIEDGVVLGDRCWIGPHASVAQGTILGNGVRIGPGARIGYPGFGFVREDDELQRMPHLGRCFLADGVEIGANATIDRGSVGDTMVGQGTKIDNLVHVAHNVEIGKRCLIMAQVGIAGSAVIEDDVILAGQAGIADHLTVGRGARVAAQAGVIGDVEPGATVSGYPARSHREVLRQAAALGKLSRILNRLEKLATEQTHE